MKKSILFLLSIALFFTAKSQMTIGSSAAPNGAAILDLESTTKGLLLPRVALTNVTTASPVTGTPLLNGTIVYDTLATTTGGSGKGIYYWDGSKWNFLANAATTSNYWSLIGNAGTTPGTNFLGTTDNKALEFKVNNQISGYLDPVNSIAVFGRLSGNMGTSSATSITAFGSQALKSLTTGSGNTAIGDNAIGAATSGGANTATGYNALAATTTASGNTGIGYSSLNANTGTLNTGLGYLSLNANTSGGSNTGIGQSALKTNTTGSSNTALGSSADVGSAALSNATAIGSNAYVTQNNSLVLGSINGTNGAAASTNVGIGTTAPSQSLEIGYTNGTARIDGLKSGNTYNSSSTTTNSTLLYANNSTGDIYALPTANNAVLITNSTGVPSWSSTIFNTAWQTLGNAGTTTATNFLGTTDNNGVAFRTNNAERVHIDSLGDVAIGSTAYDPYNRERLLVDYGSTTSNTLTNMRGSIANYLQLNVQNTSSDPNASTDIVATADNGTDSTNYVDLGINSSNYAPSVENWGGKNDAYLYAYSRNLLIGTEAASSDLIFMLGGGFIKSNTVFRLIGTNGNAVLGAGEGSSTPVGNILRGPNASPSSANTSGGNLTLQGGSSTGTATGGNVYINGGTSASGAGGIFTVSTTSSERMRVDASGNVGINTTTPGQKLEVGGTSNSARIDGLAAGGTYNSSSTATTSNLVYANNANGDLYSLPTANSSVLVTNSTGVPSWSNAISNGLFWSLTGNTATTASASVIGTTANNNFIGTTDAKPFVAATSGYERMRILSTGNIGIQNTAPTALLDVTSSATANAVNITTGNVVNVNANTVTSGNGAAITANGITQGNALNISSTSTAGTASGSSSMINISRSGANANTAHTAYGVYSTVSNTNATSGTNIGGYFSASGATTNNYGVNGVSSSANGYGVVGTNTAASGTGVGSGVFGTSSQANGYGIYGINNSTSVGTSVGVYGVKNGATGTGLGYGIYGSSTGTGAANYGGFFQASGASANYGVVVPSTGGNSGFGTTAPAQEVEVGGNANTVRIDGIGSSGTYYTGSTTAASSVLYANASGDIYSLPNVSSAILITNSSGIPLWSPSGNTNGYFWSLKGNSGATSSSSPIGSSANNFFLGTTDAQDFVIVSKGFERMRVATAGNFGIQTTTPSALLDINTSNAANAFNVTTGNVVNITANSLTTGTGLNVNSTSAITTGGSLATLSDNALTTGNGINLSLTGMTTGSGVSETANAITTGTGISVTSSSAGITTGSLMNLSSTGVISNASGSLLNINSGAANTAGYLATITGSSTTAGGVNIGMNSMTTGNALNVSANGLTNGNGLSVASASTTGTGSGSSALINLSRSGANVNASHTAYGVSSTVSNTGTTSTNVAGYFSASGATNNYGVIVPGTGGNSGFGTTAPAQKIEVGGTANTIRVDGLQSGGTYNSSTTNTNSTILYSNNTTGDVYALPTVNNAFLITNGTGVPSWGSATAANFWSIVGNTGTTASSTAIGTAANNNFHGTTDAKDYVTVTNGFERMRVTSAGNIGIQTTTPSALLDVNSSSAVNALNITTGNVVNVTANGLTSGNGINVTSTSTAGLLSGSSSMINVSRSGLNVSTAHTAYGVSSSVTNTNVTSGTNIAGYFSASGATTANYGAEGTTSTGTGTGLYGINTAASGALTGTGVLGTTAQSLGYGVQGTNSNAAGSGVFGNNSAAAGTGTGYGVSGQTLQSSGAGVYGIDNNSTANQTGLTGVYGTYNTATGYGAGIAGIGGGGTSAYSGLAYDIGVYGNAGTYGVWGDNSSTGNIYGVYGSISYAGTPGTDHAGAIEGISTAALGAGNAAGVIGKTNQSNGPGVVGINLNTGATIAGPGVLGSSYSNGATPLVVFPTGGAGGSFTGNGASANGKVIIGVAGYANSGLTTTTSPGATTYYAGGYFGAGINSATLTPNYYAYVGALNNGTNYKITGTGTVSTVVRDVQNKRVTMYCPEATEILLEDYGTAALVNGKVHVDLDPILSKNIAVNEKHQLRVMITLNDQCNGVFVTNRTKTGFDVVELNNGTSSASFTYQVVANRADEYDVDGKVLLSKNEDLRFSPGAEPAPSSAYNPGSGTISVSTKSQH